MGAIEVGCGQITWDQFRPQGANPQAWGRQVLAEIGQAGYAGAPAGPRPNTTPEGIAALYAEFGLRPAPGYLGGDFWRAELRAQMVDEAQQQARFAQGLGLSELYVSAGGFGSFLAPSGQSRVQLAGHVGPGDGLSGAEYTSLAATLNAMGEAMLEHGVRLCYHNHVGSVIETEEEIERMLALCDPALVFLGPDTGHLAWAGVDVAGFCRRHAPRILTMHLKDVSEEARARGAAARWDYGTFTRGGIFTELGEGDVNFPAVLAILREANFGGWLIAETDVTQRPSALESATVSRQYLRTLGI
jgi:inosose dehydratase